MPPAGSTQQHSDDDSPLWDPEAHVIICLLNYPQSYDAGQGADCTTLRAAQHSIASQLCCQCGTTQPLLSDALSKLHAY
jgi:hypothetical protein